MRRNDNGSASRRNLLVIFRLALRSPFPRAARAALTPPAARCTVTHRLLTLPQRFDAVNLAQQLRKCQCCFPKHFPHQKGEHKTVNIKNDPEHLSEVV